MVVPSLTIAAINIMLQTLKAKQGMTALRDDDWTRLGGGERTAVPQQVRLPRRPSVVQQEARSKSTPTIGTPMSDFRRASLSASGNPFNRSPRNSPLLARKSSVGGPAVIFKPVARRNGSTTSATSIEEDPPTGGRLPLTPASRSASLPAVGNATDLPDLAALGIIGLGDLSDLGIVGLNDGPVSTLFEPAAAAARLNFDSDDQSESGEEQEEDEDDEEQDVDSAFTAEEDETRTDSKNEVWEEVDLTRGARSKTCVWYAPSGEFEWPIQAAAPMDPSTPDGDRLDQRIRQVVDRVLILKESQAETGPGMLPGDFREVVLRLGQDYHGVIDTARDLLETVPINVADRLWHQRVQDATQQLGTKFVLVLESMAELAINFGLDDGSDARKEVVSCCSKFAIGCMHLSNSASRGRSRTGSKSFAHFSPRGRQGANQATKRSQMRVQMRELVP
jgi:hypothetical protein